MPGTSEDFTSLFTGKTEPDVKGELVTYDPRFYAKQSKLFGDWRTTRDTSKAGLQDYLASLTAYEPTFKSNVESENSFLSWLRDGGLSLQNAGLRAREHAADVAGEKNQLDFAGNNTNAAKLYFGGNTSTDSSADYNRRLAAGGRISSEFAGRDVARERADKASEINIKLATEGRINANLDKLLARELLPGQLSRQELNELTAALNAIGSGTQYGAQPKFWQDKDLAQRVGGFFQGVGDTYYGGGARAGAQPLTQQAGASSYLPQGQNAAISYETTTGRTAGPMTGYQPAPQPAQYYNPASTYYVPPTSAGAEPLPYVAPTTWQDYASAGGYA